MGTLIVQEMENIIEEFEGKDLGLFDSRHPKQIDVVSDINIEVTNMLPEIKGRIMFKYARVTRGQLVQVNVLSGNPDDPDYARAHFHFKEYDFGMLEKNIDFISVLGGLNCLPSKVARLVYENSPFEN